MEPKRSFVGGVGKRALWPARRSPGVTTRKRAKPPRAWTCR